MNNSSFYIPIIFSIAIAGCTDTVTPNRNATQEHEASDFPNDANESVVDPTPKALNEESAIPKSSLTEQQVLRLFEGEWYPNWIESAKYSKNSDHISELGHFFDDKVNPFYETSVVFYDYGVTWSRKQKITSEPELERIKLNQDGKIDWSTHVNAINENQIAIRNGSAWVVCDHWSTKQ